MSNYRGVADALASGADPAMLCETCPWDRHCIQPPSMSPADIEREKAKAEAKEREHAEQARMRGEDPGLPMRSLLTSVIYAGADTKGEMCPVFTVRLRSSQGREIADSVKSSMQGWEERP